VSALQARLQADLNAARKSQDKGRVLLLGTILADAKNRRIELMHDLVDDDVIDVIRKGIKKRRESQELAEKAGRPEIAAKDASEIAQLEQYLPASASDDEIRAAVRAAIQQGAANIGAVMAAVMPKFKGRSEGSRISALVREELAGQG
jgi:uncharacterized protein YqeY